MDIYELQSRRRTIRKFKSTPIDYKLLEKFVSYARLSSSAMNKQPIRYYIAHNTEIVDSIFAHTKWAGYLKGAHSPTFEQRPRAYILFLHDRDIIKVPRWDIGAASHAIQLMALNEGIGTCWMGAINREKILNICSINERYSLDSLISLGYPDESPVVEDAVNDDIKYYLDKNKKLHVPKRSLDEILIK